MGGFSPPEALGPWFKPPAFSRFLFQSAVKSAESFEPTSFQLVVVWPVWIVTLTLSSKLRGITYYWLLRPQQKEPFVTKPVLERCG